MPNKKSIDGFSGGPRRGQVMTRKQAEKLARSGRGLRPSAPKKAISVKVSERKREKAKEDFLKPVGTFNNFEFDEKDLEKDLKKEKKLSKKSRKDKGMKGGKKKHKKAKIIISIILVLLLGAGVFAYLWINGVISKVTDGKAGLFDFIVAKDVELKKGENGRTNILAFGTSGYNMEGDEGNGVHDGAQLTDSIMVISLDQETKDVAMLSLPRDLYVKKTCTATAKVNEVYWCANIKGNDEAAGAKALEDKVGEILGIDFQYYVHLDWQALVEVVDKLGGIIVKLDESINDPLTKTKIKAGEETWLDGGSALGLARARHGTAGGDFTRGNSQQKILMSLKDRFTEKGLGVTDAIGLLDTLGDNVRMNFNADEIKTLANMVGDFKEDSIRQVPLTDVGDKHVNYFTTSMIGGISYVVPSAGVGNYADIQKYVAKAFSSDPAVREEASILVLNGSGVQGAAAEEKDKLEKAGFSVSKVGDAPEGKYKEAYYIYNITDKMSGTIKSLEKRYDTTAKPADELPAGIQSKGYDIIIIIGKKEDTSSN